MKKFLKIGLGIFAALFVLGLFLPSEEGKTGDTPVKAKVVKAPKAFYEEIGYCKDENRNRTFIVYTNSSDREKLIKEGRKKMWTRPKLTYVTFVNTNNPEVVRDNTLYYKDWDRGILLEGMVSDETAVIGTYKVSPNGNEWWGDGLPLGSFEMLGTKRD